MKITFKVGDLVGLGGMVGTIVDLSEDNNVVSVVFTPMLEATMLYTDGLLLVDDADAYINQVGYREQLYADQYLN